MSDQISENMARKLTEALAFERAGKDMIFQAWESAGLIKPSKLDEARAWCLNTQNRAIAYHVDVIRALQTLREKYEAAITEILEERE